jgi:glycosyltransferase involved in cell wall biosynthesis
MTRLLHLQLLPLLAGAPNFSLYLLEALPRDQFDIYVASAPGDDFVDVVKECGYHYIPLKFMERPISIKDTLALAELYSLIKRYHFDIVHTNSSKPGFLGRLAASFCHTPLILHTEHATSFQMDQPVWQQNLYMRLEKWANRLCDYVVFVNNTDRIKCLDLGLVSPSKALTINNAIPYEKVEQLEKIAQERKLVSDKKDFVIGSIIRFSPAKNVINLISAACQVCKKEAKLKFIILGKGEYLRLCRQIVHSYNLDERIVLPGFDINIEKWLALFDAFILYSRWESRPFSCIEAMYSGLPVIVSDIPSLREMITDECGWIVPLDNQPALIQCLIEVAHQPEIAFKKGVIANKRIKEISDYDTMVKGYLELYQRVM